MCFIFSSKSLKIHSCLSRKLIWRLGLLEGEMKKPGRTCAQYLNANNRSLRTLTSALERSCFILTAFVFISRKRMWRINQLIYVLTWHPLHIARGIYWLNLHKNLKKAFSIVISKDASTAPKPTKKVFDFSFRKLLCCITWIYLKKNLENSKTDLSVYSYTMSY